MKAMMVTTQLEIMTMQEAYLTPLQEDLWRSLFLEFPERITRYSPRFLTPVSPVTARWRADTMLTPRLSARPSTSAAATATAALTSSASSAPMGL